MRWRRRAVIGGLGVLMAATLCVPPVAAAQQPSPAARCATGPGDAFDARLAPLAAWLGSVAGAPTCSHPDSSSGDVLQPTSTGLAYIRATTGLPTFTDGARHWAWTGAAPRCWDTPSADPPTAVDAVAQYAPSVPSGTPDPWVNGLTLASSIQPSPYAVAADDVMSALAQRCLPLARLDAPGPSPAALDAAASVVEFTDRRAAAGAQTSGWIAAFVSPFLAAHASLPHAVVRGNVVVVPPDRLSAVASASYAAALADALPD